MVGLFYCLIGNVVVSLGEFALGCVLDWWLVVAACCCLLLCVIVLILVNCCFGVDCWFCLVVNSVDYFCSLYFVIVWFY